MEGSGDCGRVVIEDRGKRCIKIKPARRKAPCRLVYVRKGVLSTCRVPVRPGRKKSHSDFTQLTA